MSAGNVSPALYDNLAPRVILKSYFPTNESATVYIVLSISYLYLASTYYCSMSCTCTCTIILCIPVKFVRRYAEMSMSGLEFHLEGKAIFIFQKVHPSESLQYGKLLIGYQGQDQGNRGCCLHVIQYLFQSSQFVSS